MHYTLLSSVGTSEISVSETITETEMTDPALMETEMMIIVKMEIPVI